MKPLPDLHTMRRVRRDIEGCIQFIARQPWGKPAEREQDILRGIKDVRARPRRNRIAAHRPAIRRDLRRHYVSQFVIVYAYVQPEARFPRGMVSIRAVRHRRVKNVLAGVREPAPSRMYLEG